MERDRHQGGQETTTTRKSSGDIFVDSIEQLRQELADVKPNRYASRGQSRAHRKNKAVKRRRN